MAKNKIQKQYIFSTKPYQQICTFLQQMKDANLLLIRDQKGNTALHQAAYNSTDVRILKKYLEHMEKFFAKSDIGNPQNQYRKFVNAVNQDGLIALHFAAYKGNYKALDLLCNNGADYTKTTNYGQNVLHLAAQGDKVQTFIFFQSLINVNSRDSKQSTPLHWAVSRNSQTIIAFLLAQPNIQIDAQNEKLQTALHIATQYGHTKIVKKLLRAGADRTILNQKNKSCLQVARYNQFKNIQRILNDKYSIFDYLKLYLNLKTVYKPETRSYVRPIFYVLCVSIVLVLRILLYKIQETAYFISYFQYAFYGILLILFLSLLTKPSRSVPKKYISFLQGSIQMKKVCLICSQLKLPRSNHCQICKTCIQRYDHHCYWINNCIGKKNIGRFIAFIVLFQILLIYIAAISAIVLYNWFSNSHILIQVIDNENFKIFGIIYAFSTGIFVILFSFPMIALIVVHIKNLFLNKTTYQRFTKDKISTLAQSTTHLLQSEISNKHKKYSLQNARTMCRDNDNDDDEYIDRSNLTSNRSPSQK